MSWFELVIVLAIMAVLCAFNIPSYTDLLTQNRLETRAKVIVGALQMAKTQALASGQALALTTLSPQYDWSEGIQLVLDNPQHQYKADIKPLYLWRWYGHEPQVTWQGFLSQHYLLVTPDLSQNAMNGTFVLRDHDQQIKVVINRLGRAKIKTLRMPLIKRTP